MIDYLSSFLTDGIIKIDWCRYIILYYLYYGLFHDPNSTHVYTPYVGETNPPYMRNTLDTKIDELNTKVPIRQTIRQIIETTKNDKKQKELLIIKSILKRLKKLILKGNNI